MSELNRRDKNRVGGKERVLRSWRTDRDTDRAMETGISYGKKTNGRGCQPLQPIGGQGDLQFAPRDTSTPPYTYTGACQNHDRMIFQSTYETGIYSNWNPESHLAITALQYLELFSMIVTND